MHKKQIDKKSLYKAEYNGAELFYSYSTLVAIFRGGELFITSEKYSVTTSKHINHIRRLCNYPESYTVSQSLLDNMSKAL